LKYLSVCSGIEAATVAWHPLGWEPVAFSEIERFPSEVLAHHYPQTPNLGDMTKFKEWNLGSNIDVFVGGTPCQSFSVAGLRKGLDDPRGNLMLTYLAITDKFRPRWLVWENVPGVLSSNGGKDFGTFLGGLGELGYGFAYRVLDAQYFGVAQRRRRVFVVGYLGDWRPAAAVLFERHSLSGDIAPRRKKREDPAKCLTRGVSQRYDFETKDLIPVFSLQGSGETSQSANGNGWNEKVSFTLNKLDVHGVVQPIPFKETADCLTAAYGTKWNGNASADNGSLFVNQPVYEMHGQDSRVRDLGDTCSTVTSKWGTGGGNVPVTMQTMAVRRLTCVECERLQGFPDHYTDIKSKNKPTPDGPRYKSLGNSMAVPVMRWIGERIQQYEEIK
jgi:DNA (cytosine-5)-methyltransferase 1